ncbi:MAG: deoxyguanosinetriphosphate triphosphohydrolase [Gammaproteobacteria bacterium]|nr:deoxyguanosinetriphosphate triphosphohydrolase [Gammaproteobacteria bacterium]NIR98202.1 deoxyguanosinetriphosphate triphosphohydrolase [Gammaproteobacteria bacterium]NIT63873.1 deoxyguanosinetriphosphate triphosphohydrolase [Gammaproteobacteria bacterium]NIV20877.1 deoxyguanosinetriphosphate triphosphohydrolase [Gammaproteobacteria bacterium]NIY32453.1 deoxyguanosinetriphosphate triphosphohydrolase [Gammaproteobacteria bacterium]
MREPAPYAAADSRSRGRRHPEPPPSQRSDYQRDRDRIIHSAAFRRLEYKTQVFVNHEGDLYRTRLTHSIEVAQIARSVARALRLNEDLTEAVALAHDLGHTPFGHAGQDALNTCMRDYGGFEHNFQSLRVVDELEEKYAAFRGLNLTFESREGIIKHCSTTRAAELGDVGRRFIEKTHPSLEAQLTNLADEIAYNSHDVDDGLRSGLITIDQLSEVDLFRKHYDEVLRTHPGLPQRTATHEVVRRMINEQAVDLINSTEAMLLRHRPSDIDAARQAGVALVCFGDEMQAQNQELKRFLREHLYRHYRVLRMSAKAARVISTLFQAFLEEPRLLPPEALASAERGERAYGTAGRARAVADYIAGMTDRYALTEHDRLRDPKKLT